MRTDGSYDRRTRVLERIAVQREIANLIAYRAIVGPTVANLDNSIKQALGLNRK